MAGDFIGVKQLVGMFVVLLGTQVTVEPCSGVLPPLSSCTVDVFFKPVACQHFETVLQLAVENGTGW